MFIHPLSFKPFFCRLTFSHFLISLFSDFLCVQQYFYHCYLFQSPYYFNLSPLLKLGMFSKSSTVLETVYFETINIFKLFCFQTILFSMEYLSSVFNLVNSFPTFLIFKLSPCHVFVCATFFFSTYRYFPPISSLIVLCVTPL